MIGKLNFQKLADLSKTTLFIHTGICRIYKGEIDLGRNFTGNVDVVIVEK